MAVDVDDTGRDEFAAPVDLGRTGGAREGRPANRLNDAVGKDDRAVIDLPPLAVEHGRVADDRRDAGIADISGWIRVFVDRDRRCLGFFPARAAGQQECGGERRPNEVI